MADESSSEAGLGGVEGTPMRLDHRYELVDRTGLSMGAVPLQTIYQLIKQGRLFPTDLVSRDGAAALPLGQVPELGAIFDEVRPGAFQVAHVNMRPRPEIAGALDRTTLAGLFARLHREGRTGRLFLSTEGGEREKVVIFQRGVPVNAMSNISEEHLGEVLIAHGVITADLFQRAVDRRRESGGRIGSALLALEAMTPRDLHRALSLQAMERLLNAFRQTTGTFSFVADESAGAEEILLFATVRELIESGLHAAMSPSEIADEIGVYADMPIEVRTEAFGQAWAQALQPGDQDVLALAGRGPKVGVLVVAVAKQLRLTTEEAQRRVLSLARFGVLGFADSAVVALEATLARLQTQHAYDALGLSRGVRSAEVVAAAEARVDQLDARVRPDDAPAAERARAKIRAVIEQAARTLKDDDQRAMYDRALQLGLDFGQADVRVRLEHEHWMTRGKSLLARKQYADARRAFVTASQKMPEDPEVYVHLGWAQFLGSSGDKAAALEAVREVERALRLSNDLDAAHATIGKIHRLAGNLREAEDCLRRAVQLNPHNNEAQSELRLIFTRELDGKAPGAKARRIEGLDSTVGKSLALFALVFVPLFYVSNMLSGGVSVWPDGLIDPNNHLLATLRDVPPALRVVGNLEHYYDAQDVWWWSRRGVLLVAGLLGMAFIVRERPKLAGPGAALALVGLLYGVGIGFLSPTPRQLSPIEITLGMTVFHVIAEQVFFVGFLFRALNKEWRDGLKALAVTALCFGLYYSSFVSIWSQHGGQIIVDCLQIGAFAGGAYAALAWRSGGLLAPLFAHLAVNVTMMLRAYVMFSQR